jgi:hypothetical protein
MLHVTPSPGALTCPTCSSSRPRTQSGTTTRRKGPFLFLSFQESGKDLAELAFILRGVLMACLLRRQLMVWLTRQRCCNLALISRGLLMAWLLKIAAFTMCMALPDTDSSQAQSFVHDLEAAGVPPGLLISINLCVYCTCVCVCIDTCMYV